MVIAPRTATRPAANSLRANRVITAPAAPAPVAQAPAKKSWTSPPAAPAKPPGLLKRAWSGTLALLKAGLNFTMIHWPAFNRLVGHFTGPYIKKEFNRTDGNPGPEPLQAKTIEDARRIMAERFKPQSGKVIIAISGGGEKTVHCFVVSDVKADGKVMISQALAQATGPEDTYKGFGGWVRKKLDAHLGNSTKVMQGVVNESWTEYAVRSHRNSVVLMEMDADPAKIQEALKEMKTLVGKPYDMSMLGADPATAATQAQMYCTEISSWFINFLKPGTVKQSIEKGIPVYQVADHMRATEVHGGPLKVLFNGQGRLDVKNLDPFPKDR